MTPVLVYDAVKYWLPIATAFGLVIKGYRTVMEKISSWADKLLNNHLHHIEIATTNTMSEAVKTNMLLAEAAAKTELVAQEVKANSLLLKEQHEKQMSAWKKMISTITILEDRTKRRTPVRRKVK